MLLKIVVKSTINWPKSQILLHKNSSQQDFIRKTLANAKPQCDFLMNFCNIFFLQAIACAIEYDDQHCGIYAGDADSYKDFAEVFDPLICEYHGLDADFAHTSDMDSSKIKVILITFYTLLYILVLRMTLVSFNFSEKPTQKFDEFLP